MDGYYSYGWQGGNVGGQQCCPSYSYGGSYGGGCGNSSVFVLIVVLFILLIIVGSVII